MNSKTYITLPEDVFENPGASLRTHMRESFSRNRGNLSGSIADKAYTVMGQNLYRILSDYDIDKFVSEIENEQRKKDEYLPYIWGDPTYSPQSALLHTLSVMVMYIRRKLPIPNFEGLLESLDELVICSSGEFKDNVGVEITIPLMHRWLKKNCEGYNLSQVSETYIESLYGEKGRGLAKLSYVRLKGFLGDASNMFAVNGDTILYLDDLTEKEIERISKAKVSSYSGFGTSVMSTVALALFLNDKGLEIPIEIEHFIYNSYKAHEFKTLPNLYPCFNFTWLWMIRNIALNGRYLELMDDPIMVKYLLKIYHDIKVFSWDNFTTIHNDGDITAMFMVFETILLEKGLIKERKIKISYLQSHFRDSNGKFYCYPGERNASRSQLSHLLYALLMIAKELVDKQDISLCKDMISSLLEQLDLSDPNFNKLTADKWNLSFTYVTQCLLSIEFLRHDPDIKKYIQNLVKVCLDRQRKDGGWGQDPLTNTNPGESPEETANIVNTFVVIFNDEKFMEDLSTNIFDCKKHIRDSLTRAYIYFQGIIRSSQSVVVPNVFTKSLVPSEKGIKSKNIEVPDIWRSKVVYTNIDITKSTIISAIESIHSLKDKLNIDWES